MNTYIIINPIIIKVNPNIVSIVLVDISTVNVIIPSSPSCLIDFICCLSSESSESSDINLADSIINAPLFSQMSVTVLPGQVKEPNKVKQHSPVEQGFPKFVFL